MKRRMLRVGYTGLLALPLALGLIEAAPVAAQTVVVPSGRPSVVPPDQVLAMLRSNGFSPLERPTRRGVTYALRAVDADGEQVRVIVDARIGTILAVTPLQPQPLMPGPGVATAPPMTPGPNVRRLPDAPPDADIATEPMAPRVYRPAGPPVVYESDPPAVYGSRPQAPVPSMPPGAAIRRADDEPQSPQIIAPERNPGGMLPPPPERFPQRVAPAPELKRKPAAPRRAVSAVLPKSPPLPRPKPETGVVQQPSAAAPADTPSAAPAPAPAVSAPAVQPSPAELPH